MFAQMKADVVTLHYAPQSSSTPSHVRVCAKVYLRNSGSSQRWELIGTIARARPNCAAALTEEHIAVRRGWTRPAAKQGGSLSYIISWHSRAPSVLSISRAACSPISRAVPAEPLARCQIRGIRVSRTTLDIQEGSLRCAATAIPQPNNARALSHQQHRIRN